MNKQKPKRKRRAPDGLYILLSFGIVFPWALHVILEMESLLPIWTIA